MASVIAAFGVVVWIFQDGHLSGPLGFTVTGRLQPSVVILILAVLFGLATDYQVFLLAKIREARLETGDNADAVTASLQRTRASSSSSSSPPRRCCRSSSPQASAAARL
jgi:trehalose monomycolate/heme transporter